MNAEKPIQSKKISQLLVLTVIVLSLISGYYYTQFKYLEKKYNMLNTKYLKIMSTEGNL